ncbi:hypothetical protein Goari_011441 [Gossypium aridum]|uniref:Uncharacterized protein n=1 Tax=Gossypium aridum TaxID=34290 RepID=A0A7J8WYE4_GOSAI|nr:hypothetical protein [Gossypium aridum]
MCCKSNTRIFVLPKKSYDKFGGFVQRLNRIGSIILYYKFDELSAKTRHFGQRTYA